MEKVVCCSTLDDRYVSGLIVFLHTLKKYTPSFNYPYYILTWGELSQENINKLNSIYDNFIFQNIENSIYEGWKAGTRWRTWTINCINRYDAFIIKNVDRVIFFDVDMLVRGDISELFDLRPDFGAVELLPKTIAVDHPSYYNNSLKSFNGGVMSISKKHLNYETRKKLVDIAFQKTWTNDEPILNTYFTNDITTYLPQKFNTLTPALTEKLLDEALVVHFLGERKPWHKGTYMQRYNPEVVEQIGGYPLVRKLDAMYQAELNEVKHLLE
jgi:lipopolysaccharide biosynthesis glycosyltransferase